MGRRWSALVGAVVMVGAFVAPAAAGPEHRTVERFEERWFSGQPNPELGIVTMLNITRDQWCTEAQVADELALLAWIQAGEVGPPPEPTAAPPEGIDLVTVSIIETGKGALVHTVHARDVPMEVWPMDADASFVGPCTDTDDADAPSATGTATFRVNDNDLLGGGSRGNAFGDHGHAVLTTTDGGTLRAHWRFHITDRCYAPDDGPPSCLVEFVRVR